MLVHEVDHKCKLKTTQHNEPLNKIKYKIKYQNKRANDKLQAPNTKPRHQANEHVG